MLLGATREPRIAASVSFHITALSYTFLRVSLLPPGQLSRKKRRHPGKSVGLLATRPTIFKPALPVLAHRLAPGYGLHGGYILHAGPPTSWVNSLASTLLQVYNPPSSIIKSTCRRWPANTGRARTPNLHWPGIRRERPLRQEPP